MRPLFKSISLLAIGFSISHAQINNIVNFGATANDQTCDNSSIQSAVNQGGTTYIPNGSFWVCGPILLPNNARLTGPGTLTLGPGTNAPIIKVDGGTNIEISQVTLDGNKSNQSIRREEGALHIINSSTRDVSVTGIIINNILNDGICIFDANRVTISGAKIYDFERHGIYQQFTKSTTISDSYIDGKLNQTQSGQHGIMIWGQNGTQIGSENHIVKGNIVKNGSDCGIWATYTRGVVFSNNIVEGFGDAGIDLEACEQSIISNNTVKNATTGGITAFYAAKNLTIEGNQVKQGTGFGPGIRILGTGVSTYISIIGNNIETENSIGIVSDQAVAAKSLIANNLIEASGSSGIRLLESDKMVIQSNKIVVGTAGSSSQNTGIAIEGGSRSFISGNEIETLFDNSSGNGDFGGILIYWRSSSFPAQYNTITNNIVSGFNISINDDCWGNTSSYNLIKDNRVSSLRRRSGTYNGLFENNKHINNPNTVVSPTTY